MKKVAALIRMEIFFSVRRSGFIIYYSILFGLMILLAHVFGGAFASVQLFGDTFKANNPVLADGIINNIMLITTFIIATFAGGGALRDYKYGSHEITFTLPLSRYQYVLGKFGGVYFVNLLLFTAPLLGYALSCQAPWLNRDAFVPFTIYTYSNIFLQKILVNVFVLSAAFFTLGLLLRNVVVNWVAIIAFFVLHTLAGKYYGQTTTRTLGALLDPYASTATASVLVGNSSEENNFLQIPFKGLLVWNRLLWTGMGLLFLSVSLWRFRFSYNVFQLKRGKRMILPGARPGSQPLVLPRPVVHPLFTGAFFSSTFFNQLRLECRQIFRNIYFYLIAGVAVLFLIFSAFSIGQLMETPGYPTTIRVLETFCGVMSIFMLLLIMVFSGETVWRDQQYRLDGLTMSTPAAPMVRLAAKTLAVYIPVLLLLVVIFIAGIMVQFLNDYYLFDTGLYFKYLFGYQAVRYLYYCLIAIGLQTLVKGKYQGYFLFALVYIFFDYFGLNLLEHGFLVPGHFPGVSYSDISGFQGGFYPFYVFVIYWLLLALLVWRTGAAFWVLSSEQSRRTKWRTVFSGGLKNSSRTTLLLMICFLGMGLFIAYNTSILNESHNSKYYNTLKSDYEKNYGSLRAVPQLSVSAVKGKIDLYPAQRKMKAVLELTLINKNTVPADRIYLNLTDHKHYKNWRPGIPWTLLVKNDKMDFYGYRLSRALLPGDSMTLTYDFDYAPHGFTDYGISSVVNANGTFINNTTFLPVIGYDASNELDGNVVRKKYGLPPKPYAMTQTDPVGLQQNMLGQGADRINLELTLSTDEGQTAIAPGYLMSSRTEKGRSYFTYRMDQPAVNYFSIQSGIYKVLTDTLQVRTDSAQQPVQLRVYYHKDHNYNIALMMKGMKDALSYYSAQFSPYQYRQLRIIEFPGSSFAQSFANTIPFSENIGFLADLRDTTTSSMRNNPVDYVYYVTAHEVAHQWWAHQILPANTEGANFLCETMAQYSALMLMKHEYGEDRVRKFLEMESFNYLTGRGGADKGERPLNKVLMEQQYIFYNKGACMMYALQDYLGENTINAVLRQFVKDYAFRERPYVTADALVGRLKAAAPDSLKYLVSDCLEKVVLYDNQLKDAVYSLNEETLEWTIEATVTGKKLIYLPDGKESEAPMDEWISIGLYDKDSKLVATQKIKVRSGTHKIAFISQRRADKLMLNPDFGLQEKQYNRTSDKIKVTKKGAVKGAGKQNKDSSTSKPL